MSRLTPADRKAWILAAAVRIARVYGYRDITREEVAKEACISQGLVTVYFKTMDELRARILDEAVVEQIPEILAQHLAVPDADKSMMTESLRKIAADHVRGAQCP